MLEEMLTALVIFDCHIAGEWSAYGLSLRCRPPSGCQVPVQLLRQGQTLGPGGLPQGVLERENAGGDAHWSLERC